MTRLAFVLTVLTAFAACGDDGPGTDPVCGNGQVEAGESCDDGNNTDGDGCDSDCTISPTCGDGTMDPGEECDDGNNTDGDGCEADCTISPSCGDGMVDPGEECDDGNSVDGDGCEADCTISPSCGDGTMDPGEECDDGNNTDGDGCEADCTITPFCGDGTMDPGEECDDGNNTDGDGCEGDCTITPFCGDGTMDPGEECDDGNNTDGDGCQGTCLLPICGDGIVDMGEGEECDDGNNVDGDGCQATCLDPVCGDGIVDMGEGEECDDGNNTDGDGCQGNCLDPICGDGIVDVGAGEECDDGNNVDADGCQGNCLDPVCGDGIVDMGEECDDGNGMDGDGCENDCTVTPVCGDGTVDPGEGCDDGNTLDGDGCAATCQREVQVGGGRDHSCALLATGDVRCWGRGTLGRLGYANTSNVGDTPATLPNIVGNVDIGGTAVQLTVGDYHNCVILDNGALRCWGDNIDGQLGYGNVDRVGDDETPASVGDVSVGGTVKQVVANGSHTCALLDTGDVRCWGDGAYGQLGYGNLDDIGNDELPSSVGPVMIGAPVVEIGVGDRHNCALLDTGDVMCWGSGAQGRLGYGNQNTIGDDEVPMSAGTVSLGGPVANLAVGEMHTCVRYASGDVRCWGQPYWGQLGYGNGAPIGDNELPTDVGFVPVGGVVVELVSGREHTCALLDTNAVRCWGRNHFGQLGYGNTEHIGDNELPSSAGDVPVGGMGTVIDIGTGGWHTCVLYDTSEVRCFGYNEFGQLGYGNTDHIGDDELPSSLPSGVPYM